MHFNVLNLIARNKDVIRYWCVIEQMLVVGMLLVQRTRSNKRVIHKQVTSTAITIIVKDVARSLVIPCSPGWRTAMRLVGEWSASFTVWVLDI